MNKLSGLDTHTILHTHTCLHVHTHTHMHACTPAHPYTHIHTHTHTHTHTHRVSCYADGVNHTNPQLFLNNEPVDAQYLETSSPSEVTLFVNNGILDEGLLGYYTCRTQNNTFTTSSILHYGESKCFTVRQYC